MSAGNHLVAALVASRLARVAAIEMVLPSMALDDLAGFGNADALGKRFVSFEFHRGRALKAGTKRRSVLQIPQGHQNFFMLRLCREV